MTTERQHATIAIKKAASVLEKMKSMLAADAYCIDIMQQNLAVIGLLKSAHQSLLEGHLQSCVSNAIKTGSNAKRKKFIEEVITVTKLAGK